MIGIVADDLTGANDIGLMYAKNNWLARIVSPYTGFDSRADAPSDVLILETNSRCDTADEAYRKVFGATELLMKYNPRHLVKKTCSVFRGNIGAEFDAMLDASGGIFAAVVAAFPENGRTTVNGIHYVNGVPLSQTPFRSDPVHPMKKDSLIEILSSQTKKGVTLLGLETIRMGAGAVRGKAQKAAKNGGYLLCDAETRKDLNVLASALRNVKCIFGSSAISLEIPLFCPNPSFGFSGIDIPPPLGGTLLLAGSVTPQSKAQVSRWIDSGLPAVEVSAENLFAGKGGLYEESISAKAAALLGKEKKVLVHVLNDAKSMKASLDAASRAGLDSTSAGLEISRSLGRIAARVRDVSPFNRLVVAGGETSNHVSLALGFRGNIVLSEIEPGLPAGLAFGSFPCVAVFKSGSFGKPDFLLTAHNYISLIP